MNFELWKVDKNLNAGLFMVVFFQDLVWFLTDPLVAMNREEGASAICNNNQIVLTLKMGTINAQQQKVFPSLKLLAK